MRLLIIDGQLERAELLKKQLRKRYVIDVATTGQSGAHLAQVCHYALILVELELPDISSQEVCRLLRSSLITIPIVVLSNTPDSKQKVSLLDLGADDFLNRPFPIDELQARIRALIRRSTVPNMSFLLTARDLILDSQERTVSRAGRGIKLRRKEFDLLEYLLRNKGRVVRRQMLIENIWPDNYDSFANVVDVHMKFLRDRIDKPYKHPLVRTIHGVGYIIDSS